MYTLYSTIKETCQEKGLSVSAMCLELGLSKSTMSDLKSGRKRSLSSDTLSKIAEFLHVSVDYLLTGEQKETPTNRGGRPTEEDIKFALFGGSGEITDSMYAEVKSFAEYVKKKHEGGKQ